MDGVTFTVEELNQLTIEQMKVLIDYYGIEHKGRLKQDYIKTLTDFYHVVDTPEYIIVDGQVQEMPAMSVRIRRIKESMK